LEFIPRGKGKAPKAVDPTDVQTSEPLLEANALSIRTFGC
jgi:hypothetical protein